MKAVAGLLLVIGHAIGFVVVAPTCKSPELTVELTPRGPVPSVPARIEHAGSSAGLDYTRWTVEYRGGFTRSVGVARLVGPRQDPAAKACVGRVIVGQRMLDDGNAGPGTVAAEMRRQIENELRGTSITGVGDFERVKDISVSWATIALNPGDVFVHAHPGGYVRATATIVFERVSVPVTVLLIPEVTGDKLDFKLYARAYLSFGNDVLQWINDKLGGNKLATRFARRQLQAGLISALAPPPPLDLPGGHKLQFGFCAGAIEVANKEWGALPFSVTLTGNDPATRPPLLGKARRAPVPPAVAVAVDLDLDALNAILHELWRAKLLDTRLAEAGLDKRFNEDPIVAEMLTLRLGTPALALPPVLSAADKGFALHADARVPIRDGETTTVGRVWGGLLFSFASPASPNKRLEPVRVSLGELELTCERTPTTLVPCFADLVAATRDRGDQFHGELTRAFGKLLVELFVDRRIAGSGLPMELVIRGALPSVTIAAGNGSLRLDLDAALVAPGQPAGKP